MSICFDIYFWLGDTLTAATPSLYVAPGARCSGGLPEDQRMKPDQPRQGAQRISGEMSEVDQVASQVVALLASRSARSEGKPREELVTRLIEAVLSPDLSALGEYLAELRRMRVSAAALADIYIPEASRRMGHSWDDDSMGFVDVTIGTARLQSLLREIGAGWIADHSGETGRGTILMVVPQHEQHTLGAMVAVTQMRRMGVSVCLQLAPEMPELRRLLATRRFDAVMLSVACEERIPFARDYIASLRANMARPTPVIVGGAVIGCAADVRALTGADVATNDLNEALKSCGLFPDPTNIRKSA
ncbi:hypothetical protein CCR83_14410 [Rhodobacter veldkampii DSM 11550]|uniref:B12-binding domain-containing protein n=2 Tax=Phaeovulum veldkampii TaxID=33049 RepID=A0A2T4JIJ9_9RHOB|nr:hypothetical protein [Phaeovulum veldkampii DSM 11550]PTE17741.1 hypothetical protein C5F46_07785 [Phaeovulum veldkampii DSM 11550]